MSSSKNELSVPGSVKSRLRGGQIAILGAGAAASIVSWALPVDFPIGEEIWLPLLTAGLGFLLKWANKKAAAKRWEHVQKEKQRQLSLYGCYDPTLDEMPVS